MGHRHCWGGWGQGAGTPVSLALLSFPLSLLPFLFICSFIHSFVRLGVEHQLWAKHSAGLWEKRRKQRVLLSGSVQLGVGGGAPGACIVHGHLGSGLPPWVSAGLSISAHLSLP